MEMFVFPGGEWAMEFCRRVSGFRGLFRRLRGRVLVVLRRVPGRVREAYGLDPLGFLIEVDEHGCRGVQIVDPLSSKADFIFTADYDVWVKGLRGEVSLTQAFMDGRIRFKGKFLPIMASIPAILKMIEEAQRIPTLFLE